MGRGVLQARAKPIEIRHQEVTDRKRRRTIDEQFALAQKVAVELEEKNKLPKQ